MTMGARRVRDLTLAGATDSVGLAVGWTVFNLLAVYRHGLAVTGLLNAAMLCGVALSAPVAGWVTQRLSGRHTLQVTAAVECLLRAGTLALLYWDFPVPLLTVMVLASHVVAWTGYAAMRAEIAAAGRHESAMTTYVAVIVTAEAVGASIGAVLPITGHGAIAAQLVAVVVVVYGITLLPTALVARGSRIVAQPALRTRGVIAANRRVLATGTVLMVLCSGPTLLYIALSARLHGRTSIVGAAVAFAAGSLLAPAAGRVLRRSNAPNAVIWPVWGAGMIIGWALAPWSVVGLWLAQLLSGICFTGFEGAMDMQLAGAAEDGAATTALAHGSAARGLGGALSVRMVPMFAGAAALPRVAAGSCLLCLLAALAAFGWQRSGRTAAVSTPPADAALPTPVSSPVGV